MNPLRVVVLVSGDASDIYVANRLIQKLTVVGVVVEERPKTEQWWRGILQIPLLFLHPLRLFRKLDRKIERLRCRSYVNKTRQIQQKEFGREGKTILPGNDCKIIHTRERSGVNHPHLAKQIKALRPDILLLSGCSLLSHSLLLLPPLGTINLHGGLSQRYRGTWTTYWALLNEEPEWIGTTVHYVTEGIDDGEIIYQERPTITKEDNPESLYIKVIKLGVSLLVRTVQDMQERRIQSFPLEERGRLYQNSMISPREIRQCWQKTEQGLLQRYLEEKKERDSNLAAHLRRTPSEHATF